jgi:putative MATE family efflux protein
VPPKSTYLGSALSDIIPLSLPILAEQALIVSMSAINAAMASNVGKEAASAIGMVDAITWVILGFFSALALGGTVIVAQAWGRGDRKEAERAAAQALTASVVLATLLGALASAFAPAIISFLYPEAESAVARSAAAYLRITALGYPFLAAALSSSGALRGAGDTKTPMLVNVSMNVVNVASSAILINGLSLGSLAVPALGVKGAASGITIARVFGAFAFARAISASASVLRISSIAQFRPDFPVLGKVFSIGIPSAIENLTFNGGKLLCQTYIVSLGTESIAANYIASSISSFLQIPGTSLQLAATTLVGQAVGRKDPAKAKRNLIVVTALGALSLLIGGIPGFPLAERLALIYTRDPGVLPIAAKLLRLMFVASPLFWAPSFILPSGFRGSGDVKYPMAVSMASMWTIRVSLGYVLALPLGLGVFGVWLAMVLDWIIRVALFGARLRSGKWYRPKA